VTVELQWCRLREIETGKERRWGATVFEWERGLEARRLHGVEDGRFNEEWHDGWGGLRGHLEVKDDKKN
jgi:hypothetical protein